MTKIYILVDPVTDQIRYVGKTTTPLTRRLKGHIEKSRDRNNKWHAAQWIRSLTDEGLVPIIECVRDVEDQYINETEIFCIEEYKRLGCDLTNNTIGGDGGVTSVGRTHSAEALRKRTATRRARGINGSAWRGKKQPQTVVDARMAGYTPEKRTEAVLKAKATRERRKQIAEAFGEKLYSTPNRLGHTASEETKELLREKAREQWAKLTPEEYEKNASNLTQGHADWRAKVEAGEVVDPRVGRDPWNKGIDQGPEVGLKSWETKRANGFVSQKEMIADIAERTAETHAKVERTIKGHSDKVAEASRLVIWKFIAEHGEEYPRLTIRYTDEYYSLVK